MISYIKLKNFKSFSDVQLDLRGAHGIPKKVALIYGENGSRQIEPYACTIVCVPNV